MPVPPPADEEIAAIAARYGLGLGPGDLGPYRELIVGALTSYDAVEQLYAARRADEPGPPARPWRRPAEADNELGAWYVVTDITADGDGPRAGRRVAVKDNIALDLAGPAA